MTCAFATPADRATPHIATRMYSFTLIKISTKTNLPENLAGIPVGEPFHRPWSELFNTHCSRRLNPQRFEARLLPKNKVCIARALLHARYNAHLAGSC
jgi:hypothetical protein